MNRSVRRMLSGCMVASALACGGDDSGSDGDQVTFTKDIHPIFESKCSGPICHSDKDSFLPGHAVADVNVAYAEVTGPGSSDVPVYQLILLRVASENPQEVMPPSFAMPPCGAPGSKAGIGQPGCLTQAEYDLIEKWVDEGRPK